MDTLYTSVSNDMTIAGLPTTDLSILYMQEDCRITLPNAADFTDAVSAISYDLPAGAPESAIARVAYEYDGRAIGAAYLMHNRLGAEATSEAAEVSAAAPADFSAEAAALSETEAPSEDAEKPQPKRPAISIKISAGVKIALTVIFALALVAGGLLALKFRIEKREAAERAARYERRQKRLQDIGMSTADFDLLLEKKRYKSALRQSRPRKRPRRHPSFLDKKH